VRADLTLLDDVQQSITLDSGHDLIVNFRVVRTGRISGLVIDANDNGRLDDGERPLPDVRVVTGSGRDTLTDENGYFIIGDLPPGEHILLLDEKTMPEPNQIHHRFPNHQSFRWQRNLHGFSRRSTTGSGEEIPRALAENP
jgi:hypothetical protein